MKSFFHSFICAVVADTVAAERNFAAAENNIAAERDFAAAERNFAEFEAVDNFVDAGAVVD